MCVFFFLNSLIDHVIFQSHDTQEAVWGGGQLAPGSGQCAGALPKVYGHPSDPPTIRKVSTSSQSVLHPFSTHFNPVEDGPNVASMLQSDLNLKKMFKLHFGMRREP